MRLALSENLLDYSGLYPPERLPLSRALANFRDYQDGPQAFLLGRLVVGPLDLEPLLDLLDPFSALRLCVVAQHDAKACFEAIELFHARASSRVRVDTVEVKLDESEGWKWWAHHWGYHLLVEMTPDEARSHLSAFRWGPRVGAKLRTAGHTPDAVLGFMRSCSRAHLPFKAVGPVGARAVRLVASAAWVARGVASDQLEPLLDEEDPSALRWGDESLQWRDLSLSLGEAREARRQLCRCFGVCSFTGSVAELKALQWI